MFFVGLVLMGASRDHDWTRTVSAFNSTVRLSSPCAASPCLSLSLFLLRRVDIRAHVHIYTEFSNTHQPTFNSLLSFLLAFSIYFQVLLSSRIRTPALRLHRLFDRLVLEVPVELVGLVGLFNW